MLVWHTLLEFPAEVIAVHIMPLLMLKDLVNIESAVLTRELAIESPDDSSV